MRNYILFVLITMSNWAVSQVVQVQMIADIKPILEESSGICFISPMLYTHNDSGGDASIFELDTLGNLMRTISVTNATNVDWEEVAKDDLGNLFIGDFGNNLNDRTDLKIYSIPNPNSFSGNNIPASIINFSYPDQYQFPPNPPKRNFDTEAMVVTNDSIFLFTKNRTSPFSGYCKLYKIPATPGNYVAQLVDSIQFCQTSQTDCWVTAASLSANKEHLVLLSGNKVWWFSCFTGTNFFKGKMKQIDLSNNSQKEGITFSNEHQLYITDEYVSVVNVGGNLYSIDLLNYLALPDIDFIADTIECVACSITPDSFTGSLLWNTGETTTQINPNTSGWYSATAISVNNCEAVDSVYVNYSIGKDDHSFESYFKIISASNNTIKGSFYSQSATQFKIILFNLQGQAVGQYSTISQVGANQFEINVQASSSVLFLRLSSNEMQVSKKLVMVE